ncbi:DUF6776 family protein [Nitrosococcus watsonii]|uniref:Uncharacterized protein n=1 Tax=Nitrosococcus watsoni (strain C-113) TaxID=105559 RepID=D8K7E4_NITWC|nr:DUF6776 family protein [Nitrosococcus watsonii]ADJ28821.1 conserved hypothetical protein [Nitrosococcus watsonii C-113]
MAKNTAPRLVIKEHRPWRGWLLGFVLIIFSGTVGWLLSYWLPPLPKQILNSSNSPLPISISQKQLSHLQQENSRLQERLARLQQELEVEQYTRADLNANLVSLQDEMQELTRQLSVYKGLTESLEEQGIHIHDLKFSKTATERLLHYRLVLTQGRRVDHLTQGQVHFVIHGALNGKPGQLELDALSKGNPLRFKFKYFQILEGEVFLPKNFKPTRVKVTLLPKEHPSKVVKQTFSWKSLEG